jgi:hypothetical protein
MDRLLIPIGLLLLIVAVWIRKRTRAVRGAVWRIVRGVGIGLLSVLAVIALAAGGVGYWYTHRPLPPNARETLFEGVTYTREMRRTPRPIITHIVTVDLSAPGLRFLVTPGQPTGGRQLAARTTSQFLAEFGLQLAINGDFFEPWHSSSPWDYYPHVGDPVNVLGFASSRGALYSTGRPGAPTLFISSSNEARFNWPAGEIYNAISGSAMFLEHGQLPAGLGHPYHDEPQPRTAVALDRDRRTLIIVLVDGRQPNYSEGVTLAELAEIVTAYRGDTALNLDGGGSTTLVMQGRDGRPVQLNSPIDNRIPGRERPVANHLGIYARRR